MNSHQPSRNHQPRSLPELTVSGTPYEMGCQHGAAFGQQIRDFLGDRLARINLLRRRPLAWRDAMRIAARYAWWIRHDLSNIAEEIAGIAHGAGISYEEAVLLQIRRELIYTAHDYGDCTSIATREEDGRALIAQTIDLAGRMGDMALILRLIPEDPTSPRVCMFTFMGLCGYAGLNSAGLAVGLNMVFSPSWRVGVPAYLLLRSLLGKRSLAEAFEEINRVRRASSRYLAISDSQSVAGVEMTVDDLRVLNGRALVHANHYLDPEFQKLDTLGGAVLQCSQRRTQRVQRLLAEQLPLEMILRDHDGYPRSICAHDLGDSTTTDTIGAIVIDAAKGEMKALLGHPCERDFCCYHVTEVFQNASGNPR